MLRSFVQKSMAINRGLVLAIRVRLTGGARTRIALRANLVYLVELGSPYTARTFGRLSGLGCPAADLVLNGKRRLNRERWAARDALHSDTES